VQIAAARARGNFFVSALRLRPREFDRPGSGHAAFPTMRQLTASHQRTGDTLPVHGMQQSPADSDTRKCASTTSKVSINPTCRHLESAVSAT